MRALLDLQNGLDALAANDVEQRERRSGRALGSTLQLGHLTDSQIQKMREHGLAHARLLT
jgi:hypothetical protein